MRSRSIRTEHARAPDNRLRPQRFEPIPLFPVTPDSPVARKAAVAAEARELWVGVHLPWLAVEALGPRDAVPRAIVDLQGQTQYVVAMCARAEHWGIRPGMSLAAALALVPSLETTPRDLQREKQLLERLAA